MKKVVLAVTCMCISMVAGADTVVTQQAKQKGFTSCVDLVESISAFALDGDSSSSLSTWHIKDPDNHLFNSMAVTNFSDGSVVNVIDVQRTRAGGCDGSLTNVIYLPRSCASAREKDFGDWEYAGDIGGLVRLDKGTSTRLLLPAGSGCVAVGAEAVYN